MFYKILSGGFIALCLMCAHTLQAQECATVGNIIKSVSISGNGTVFNNLITWDRPLDLPSGASYIIYEYKGGTECSQSLTIINGLSATSWTDPDAGMLQRSYTMSTITVESLGPGPITQQHAKAIITKVDFDNCTYNAEIHWMPYVGWDNKDTKNTIYAVYADVGNTGSYTLLPGAESLTATSYVWRNAPTRETIKMKVQAVDIRDNTAVSDSKQETVFFDFQRLPRYIQLSELHHNGGSYTLSFAIDPDTELTAFEVQRATEDGDFSTVYNFSDKNLSSWTDDTDPGLFRYRIVAKNARENCIVTTSNEIVNLQLEITPDEHNWYLHWTHANTNEDLLYTLDRIQPNPANLLMFSAATVYSDPIPAVLADASLRFCYSIRGEVAGAFYTDIRPIITTSENCISYKPTVIMPDAIDPLSTVINSQTGRARNQFGPLINADARTYSYRLTIMNRNGAVVADIVKNINDDLLDKSWDGRLKNGNMSPEEVYTYHLLVEFESEVQEIMTGTVVVVYSK